MPELQAMMGKEVEVIANGLRYTGILIEVSDSEVYIKGTLQWFFLPTASVSSINLKAGAVRPKV